MTTAKQWWLDCLPEVGDRPRLAAVAPVAQLSASQLRLWHQLRQAAYGGDDIAAAALWDLFEDAGSDEVWYLGQRLPIGEARSLAGV